LFIALIEDAFCVEDNEKSETDFLQSNECMICTSPSHEGQILTSEAHALPSVSRTQATYLEDIGTWLLRLLRTFVIVCHLPFCNCGVQEVVCFYMSCTARLGTYTVMREPGGLLCVSLEGLAGQ
jgi:hypothetical protein